VVVLTPQLVILIVKINGVVEMGLVPLENAYVITLVGGSQVKVHLKGIVKVLLVLVVRSVVMVVAIISVLVDIIKV
jgi:hypothetical protein